MNAVTTTDHEEAPRLPSLQSGGQVRAIVPQDFDGAWRIANAVAKAGMAPKGLETPEKAMVAIMHGMEVGMTPMAALQSIAVVNGRPTIWGDGAIGLVRSSGKLEWIKETITGTDDSMVATCEVKRKGDPEPVKATFSVADAKKAGLWGKQGPWQQYPKRMLAMRARAFALRDTFADILRGLGIAEEVGDYQPMRDVTPSAPPVPPKPPVPPQVKDARTERQREEVTAHPVQQSDIVDAEDVDPDPGEVVDEREIVQGADEQTAALMSNEPDDDTDFFERLEEAMGAAADLEVLEELWTEFDPLARFDGKPNGETNQSIALAIRKRAEKRIGSGK